MTRIEDYMFYYCGGLTNVTMGNSVTSIGNRSFSDCSGLTNVVLPNSVTYTGGTGPHRADRLILDYVHAAKLLGLDVSRITVETADKALAKKIAAFGALVEEPARPGGGLPSGLET